MLDASLEEEAEFGHFCEIGKKDLENNTRIELKALEKNVSYHAVDLSTMFAHPRLSPLLKSMMQDMLDKRQVRPLPTKVFDAAEAVDALRFMAGGKHMGKVLIKMAGFQPEKLSVKYRAQGVYIITGGLGGFGMELARWLLQRGASQVVLLSRSGLRTSWQRFRHNALVEAFGEAAVKGVWHCAMVLKDTLFENMTQDDWDIVNSSKV